MTSVCVYKLCQGKLVPSLLAFMVASSQKVARQLTSIARETSKFKTSWVGRNLKDGLPPGLHRWMKAEPDLDLQPLCSADLTNPLWSQQPAWLHTGLIQGETDRASYTWSSQSLPASRQDCHRLPALGSSHLHGSPWEPKWFRFTIERRKKGVLWAGLGCYRFYAAHSRLQRTRGPWDPH